MKVLLFQDPSNVMKFADGNGLEALLPLLSKSVSVDLINTTYDRMRPDSIHEDFEYEHRLVEDNS